MPDGQLPVADAGLQCAAGRRGVGLDRPAAARADPLRAAADAPLRSRLLVVVGLALFAASCFLNSDINQDYTGPQFLVPNLVRAVGQALVMTPLSVLATGGIEHEQASSASALFNMMRNLGGSIGIALLQTLLTRREQFHSAVINPRPCSRQRLAGLQHTSWRPAPRRPGDGMA